MAASGKFSGSFAMHQGGAAPQSTLSKCSFAVPNVAGGSMVKRSGADAGMPSLDDIVQQLEDE